MLLSQDDRCRLSMAHQGASRIRILWKFTSVHLRVFCSRTFRRSHRLSSPRQDFQALQMPLNGIRSLRVRCVHVFPSAGIETDDRVQARKPPRGHLHLGSCAARNGFRFARCVVRQVLPAAQVPWSCGPVVVPLQQGFCLLRGRPVTRAQPAVREAPLSPVSRSEKTPFDVNSLA